MKSLAMTHVTQELAHQAVRLSPTERIELVETILASLDKPDPELSALWAREAESRLDAYHRGELTDVDEAEVLKGLDGP